VSGLLMTTNPSAGSHDRAAVEAALEVLRRGSEVEVVESGTPEELEKALRGLGERDLVVAGGDGSLHTVVNALYRLDLLSTTRLGLVPLGTGNDFARGAGVPLDPAEAAGVVAAGHCEPIDLMVDDTGLVIVNNVHLGVGAQASRDATRWKKRLGRFGYLIGALVAGIKPHFIRVTVTVDGRDLMQRRRVAQVAIGNGSSVGGGTELLPGADLGDGLLLVIVSRAMGHLSRLVYAARLRGGTHHLMKEVSRVTGREVTVRGDDFWLTADGELSGPHRQRRWTVLPEGVRLFRPEAGAYQLPTS
jgi:diacylglycerol kinase (ATP)